MNNVRDLMLVQRIKDTDKVYMVWDCTGDNVKLCPYDADSVNYGAKRTKISKARFWKVYEDYSE